MQTIHSWYLFERMWDLVAGYHLRSVRMAAKKIPRIGGNK